MLVLPSQDSVQVPEDERRDCKDMPYPGGSAQLQGRQSCCLEAGLLRQPLLQCQHAACNAAGPGGLPALGPSMQEHTMGDRLIKCSCRTRQSGK